MQYIRTQTDRHPVRPCLIQLRLPSPTICVVLVLTPPRSHTKQDEDCSECSTIFATRGGLNFAHYTVDVSVASNVKLSTTILTSWSPRSWSLKISTVGLCVEPFLDRLCRELGLKHKDVFYTLENGPETFFLMCGYTQTKNFVFCLNDWCPIKTVFGKYYVPWFNTWDVSVDEKFVVCCATTHWSTLVDHNVVDRTLPVIEIPV